MLSVNGWVLWASISAVFAALTAIFAKIGLQDIDSDLATLIRTWVIIIILPGFIWFTGKWTNPTSPFYQNMGLSQSDRPGYGRILGLLCPCASTR